MKKFFLTHKTLLLFLFILCVAAFLRLYKLDSLPAGLAWDEAAIGYNGYGILTVRRDEWLNRLPITFKSFGDYKAAVAVYMAGASVALFGLDTFAVRFPMAMSGVVTTAAAFFIGISVFKRKRFALLFMLLVAISPLNVHFSRIAFESGIAVMFVAVGIACILHAQKRAWLFVAGMLSLSASLYAYHSTKIVVPIVLLVCAVKFWPIIKQHKRWVVASVAVFALSVYPLVRESLYGHAADRFFMASQITNGKELKPLGEVAGIVTTNLLAHFDPSFLVLGKSSNFRHGNGQFGILSFVEIALVLVGFFALVKEGKMRSHWWVFVLFFAAFLPATIGDDVPHSNRSHLIIPWVQLIAVFGVRYIVQRLPKKIHMKSFVVLAVLLAVQLVWQAQVYERAYSTDAVRDFQYGYKEAVLFAKSQEGSSHKILFTSAYGQPYIYVLMYKKLNPMEYQQGALANYEIRDLKWENERTKTDVLIIGTPEEIPADVPNIIKEILYPDGAIAFRIVKQ